MTEKYYFDTAIFIYAIERCNERAKQIITESYQNGKIGTSVITLMEYITGCYKKASKKESLQSMTMFNELLTNYGFEVKNIDREVVIVAAQIRANYPFKQMDSLQLASAVVAGADVFYTNDKQLLQFKNNVLEVRLMES